MLRARLIKIAIALIVLGGILLYFRPVSDKSTETIHEYTQQQEAVGLTPDAQEPSVASGYRQYVGNSVMYVDKSNLTGSSQNNAEMSCSVTKQNTSKEIMPGVSITSDHAISIKTVNKDETIQIQRDKTFGSETQVLLKRKF